MVHSTHHVNDGHVGDCDGVIAIDGGEKGLHTQDGTLCNSRSGDISKVNIGQCDGIKRRRG